MHFLIHLLLPLLICMEVNNLEQDDNVQQYAHLNLMYIHKN